MEVNRRVSGSFRHPARVLFQNASPLRFAFLRWLFFLSVVVAAVPVRAQAPYEAGSVVSLSGKVTEQDGQLLAGVPVVLHQAGSRDQTATTDPGGLFRFHVAPGAAFTVEVRAQGRPPVVRQYSTAKSGVVALVVPPVSQGGATGASQSSDQFHFSDAPDFQVAGITDWTAVGGHGSDATLRTSEELARDIAAPDLSPGASAPSVSASDRAAEETLRARLGTAPGDYAATEELGALYLREGRYHEAVPVLAAASTLHGHAAEDEYLLAEACAGVGDVHKAEEHIRAALAKEQKAEFFRFAGELSEKEGDPLKAVAEEQRATQLDPSEANYLAWASELLLHRAVWQAIDVLAKGAQAHPRSPKIQAAWGAALFAGARYSEASAHLCEASDLDPASREAYVLLGQAILGSPAPLPCATTTLARFLRLRPEDPQALFFNAMLVLKARQPGDRERAQRLLRHAVALQPNYAEAYLQLGILATSAHQNSEAVHFLQQAIVADPQLAEAHFRLGVLYDRDGKNAEAQKEFQRHEVLAQQQRDATEEERRRIKQFVVVPEQKAAGDPAP